MPIPKREGVEAVGMRLHRDAIKQLKFVAVERGSNVSALTQEALSFWWAAQPESKARGPLFPGEGEQATATTAPATPTEVRKKGGEKPKKG
jgi:hypothetical protein